MVQVANNLRRWIALLACSIFFVLSGALAPSRLAATEGAISFYVPGLYGDFGPAVTPEPGVYLFNTGTYYAARTTEPILNLPAQQSFDGFAYINLLRGFWVTDKEIFGARYAAGIRIPHVRIGLDVDLTSPLGTQSLNADITARGDLGIIPVSLYWTSGNFRANLYETITAPTGEFSATSFPNTGRNHWSFDTVLAISWTDLERGLEIAVIPGVIVNTENGATKYRSGIEFHIDYMLNRLLTPTIGIGLHGSYYRQLTDDSGRGAFLGPFKGRASSIGPAALLRPKIAGNRGYIAIKWLHEFAVENRFEGNLFTATAGFKF